MIEPLQQTRLQHSNHHHDAQPAPPSADAEDSAFVADLRGALDGIEAPGTFASFAALKRPLPVGLFVDGIGDIATPLDESQAAALIAKSRQAPYGKGSATIVDTSVRRTWELDADQFEFRDPKWPSCLERLCGIVAEKLGIDSTIRAEIYKMLIYEKGAMFKPHTDTEKIPGMFGTLVICLPSEHRGGDLEVVHRGERKVWKTSQSEQSFGCWYSDVTHQIRPVTSGFRWVLTYNLAYDSDSPRPQPALSAAGMHGLADVLHRWLAEDKASRRRQLVYYGLNHNYTEASVSLTSLKKEDYNRVLTLKELSESLPFHLYFALLEMREMGSCYFDHSRSRRKNRWGDYDDDEEAGNGPHDLEDVFESELTVKTVTDLEGGMVMENVPLKEEDIVDEEAFAGVEPEEEYEGFMGNSGPTATHWYRYTAVVIVPSDSLMSFFESSPEYLSPAICSFAIACQQGPTPEHTVTALENVFEEMWKDDTLFPNDGGPAIEEILKAAMVQDRPALFLEASLRCDDQLTWDFFDWVRDFLKLDNDGSQEQFQVFEEGYADHPQLKRYEAVAF